MRFKLAASSKNFRNFWSDIQNIVSHSWKTEVLHQPRSQGLSSSRPSLAPGGGKMRDPGNEVGNAPKQTEDINQVAQTYLGVLMCIQHFSCFFL